MIKMVIDSQQRQPPLGGAMTFQEYLALERAYPNARYEYLNGVARLMAGGRVAHDQIAFNARVAIAVNFRSGPCHTFGENMKVLVGTLPDGSENRVMPDCTVSCDVDDRRLGNTMIRSPRIVIEVLSPSTEATDRGDKLQAYKACPSIQEYLLISQFAQYVEIYRRDREDATIWRKQEYGPGETVELQSVDIAISMDEIYRGINFAEFLMEE
jgi:Uma2 family endonuclease